MVKVINTKQTETVYTIELTEKELNTLVRFLGNTSESDYKRIILDDKWFVDSSKLLSLEESEELYKALQPSTTYINM